MQEPVPVEIAARLQEDYRKSRGSHGTVASLCRRYNLTRYQVEKALAQTVPSEPSKGSEMPSKGRIGERVCPTCGAEHFTLWYDPETINLAQPEPVPGEYLVFSCCGSRWTVKEE